MACPYMPSGTPKAAPPSDPTGEHASLSTKFEALLPDCSKPAQLLEECRDRVGRAGHGHCASEVKCLTG